MIYVKDRLRNFFFKAASNFTTPNERELQTSLTTFKNLLKCRSCIIGNSNQYHSYHSWSRNSVKIYAIDLFRLSSVMTIFYHWNSKVYYLTEGLRKIANFYKIVGMKSNINKPFKIVIRYTPYYWLLLTMTMIFPKSTFWRKE